MKLVKGTKMPDFTYLSPYAEGEKSFAEFAQGTKTYGMMTESVCAYLLNKYKK